MCENQEMVGLMVAVVLVQVCGCALVLRYAMRRALDVLQGDDIVRINTGGTD